MPGAIVHAGADIGCSHPMPSQAKPNLVAGRVTVSGQVVVTIDAQYRVEGCPNPSSSGGPCATARWLGGAIRVRVLGKAVAIETGLSVCTPTPGPMTPRLVQKRVIAT